MGRNGLAEIRRLSITPTAKRNSYRVAILVGQLPRVAGHARNPGLCNRNSYRAAAADGWPLPGPPEGTEKVPFFYDQNGKCLRFVTSLSANRLNKAKIDR